MASERTIIASGQVASSDHASEEHLPFSLAVLLHLLPGTLLMGAALILAPPLIERGVLYDLVHIASSLLTIVPFMVGVMLVYGRAKHGRATPAAWHCLSLPSSRVERGRTAGRGTRSPTPSWCSSRSSPLRRWSSGGMNDPAGVLQAFFWLRNYEGGPVHQTLRRWVMKDDV
jgi:hypothetical protein